MGRPHLLGFGGGGGGGYQILQGDTKFTRKFGMGILNFWGYQTICDTGSPHQGKKSVKQKTNLVWPYVNVDFCIVISVSTKEIPITS